MSNIYEVKEKIQSQLRYECSLVSEERFQIPFMHKWGDYTEIERILPEGFQMEVKNHSIGQTVIISKIKTEIDT
jgi:hypothetical protein